MRWILIDIGNTRTKLVLSDEQQFFERHSLPTTAITPEALTAAIASWSHDGAVVCSVVPERTAAVRLVFKETLLEVTHRTPLGIGIDYPEPESIGPDRLADAAALAHRYGGPSVAIDFGTAVTFDIVSASLNYVGGIIAPGVEMMSDYMNERTALLPRIDLVPEPPIIGKSTVQAMQAGAYYGYVGMIREILRELLAALQVESRDVIPVVATGGMSRFFAAALPEIRHLEPDLTLLGLRLIAQRHAASERPFTATP